jgi:hypothetical protein
MKLSYSLFCVYTCVIMYYCIALQQSIEIDVLAAMLLSFCAYALVLMRTLDKINQRYLQAIKREEWVMVAQQYEHSRLHMETTEVSIPVTPVLERQTTVPNSWLNPTHTAPMRNIAR